MILPITYGVVTNKPGNLYFSTMSLINFDYHPQFFTATILEWKPLLRDDSYKDIIIKSLKFLKEEGSIVIYSFVIMSYDFDFIWQIEVGYILDYILLRFLIFTAQLMNF